MSVYLALPPGKKCASFAIPICYAAEPLKLYCTYLANINDPEILAVHYAIRALEAYVDDTADEGRTLVSRPIYVLSDHDTVSFTREAETTALGNELCAGTYIQLVVCYTHIWKNLCLNIEQMAAVFMEELLHCVYNISDETEVKRKTVDILRYIWPHLDFKTFYGSMPGLMNFT